MMRSLMIIFLLLGTSLILSSFADDKCYKCTVSSDPVNNSGVCKRNLFGGGSMCYEGQSDANNAPCWGVIEIECAVE